MPLGLIKDEMMYEPKVVFKSQLLSREAKIYSCEDIPQVGSLTLKMVSKKKTSYSLLAFHTNQWRR